MLILKTLALEPMHGYGIAVRLEQMGQGVFRVNAGSLFVAFQRLERAGLTKGEWKATENSRRAKCYALADRGRKGSRAKPGNGKASGSHRESLGSILGEAMWRSITSGLRSLFRKKRVGQELDEELNGFLEMAAEEKIKQGASRRDALRSVRLERGSFEGTKETVRSAGWESFVETCWQDLAFAVRMLRKSPGFAAVVVLTLALGIGANTAIFSIVNAVLLRRLPYANANQLVFVSEAKRDAGSSGLGMSYPTFTELRDDNRVFSAVAGLGGHALVLTGYGEPSEVSTVVVTSEFFSVLAAEPLLGRVFIPEDGQRGAASVVVLSENL